MTAPADDAGRVAAVLAVHQRMTKAGGPCWCGDWPDSGHRTTWTEHVADAVLASPVWADRLAAEAARADAAEAALGQVRALAEEWKTEERALRREWQVTADPGQARAAAERRDAANDLRAALDAAPGTAAGDALRGHHVHPAEYARALEAVGRVRADGTADVDP